MNRVFGYRHDLEDHAFIRSLPETQWRSLFKASYDKPLDRAVRDRFKIQIPIENQASQGACVGHGGTTGAEFNELLQTGECTPLSRQAAYIWAQEATGIRGDSGASITGLATQAMRRGFCVEELWRYTGRYDTLPPGGREQLQRCIADAAGRKLERFERLGNYADIAQWLQTGQGAVLAGIPWYSGFNQKSGVINSASGRFLGYHCIPWLWQTDRTHGSRNYLELPNSWGHDWGNGGWGEMSPALIDWFFRDRNTVVVGMSNMTGDHIRTRVDFLSASYLQRV